MEPRNYENYFSTVIKICNVRKLNFHSLRHKFATRTREADIDIKVLSEILGHSSYHITQEIYVYISIDFKKKSINNLFNYIHSIKFVEHI